VKDLGARGMHALALSGGEDRDVERRRHGETGGKLRSGNRQ
jgi:hypothetical protein